MDGQAREYEVRTKELKSLAKRKLPYPPNFKQVGGRQSSIAWIGNGGFGAVDQSANLSVVASWRQDVEDPVEKTMHYMLVTRAWLDAWRVYINDFSQPKPQPPTNETLLCVCDNRSEAAEDHQALRLSCGLEIPPPPPFTEYAFY